MWSHDEAALETARARQAGHGTSTATGDAKTKQAHLLPPLTEFTVEDIEQLFLDPLGYYIERGLRIPDEWDTKREGVVLPLSVEEWRIAKVCLEAFDGKFPTAELGDRLRAADVLQVAPYDETEIDSAQSLVKEFAKAYFKLFPSDPETLNIQLTPDSLGPVSARIARYHRQEKTLAHVSFRSSTSAVARDAEKMFIRALVAIAAGHPVESVVMLHVTPKGDKSIKRTMAIDAGITPVVATGLLSSLLMVEPVARSIACPQFSGAAEALFAGTQPDAAVAEDKFDLFVENDFSYPGSNELIVYGAQPDFAAVYADPHGLMNAFFRSYFSVRSRLSGGLKGWEVK